MVSPIMNMTCNLTKLESPGAGGAGSLGDETVDKTNASCDTRLAMIPFHILDIPKYDSTICRVVSKLSCSHQICFFRWSPIAEPGFPRPHSQEAVREADRVQQCFRMLSDVVIRVNIHILSGSST